MPYKAELRTLQINGIDYNFRWCPPGTFKMGSKKEEKDRGADEQQHKVTLTNGFWIMETEVTQKMWKNIMGSDIKKQCDRAEKSEQAQGLAGTGDDNPMYYVNWDEANQFCENLNILFPIRYKDLQLTFRLPTEAEWEYACRADTETPFSFGDKLNGDKANCDGRDHPYRAIKNGHLGQTSLVGSYAPNPWGLYDMHGNLYEWCSDWYGDYPSTQTTDPQGPDNGRLRVARGGAWRSHCRNCRSARRATNPPNMRNIVTGFRVVLGSPLAAPPIIPQPINNPKPQKRFPQAGDLTRKVINDVEYRFRWCNPGSVLIEKNLEKEIERGFWLLESVVTQKMWFATMGTTVQQLHDEGFNQQGLDPNDYDMSSIGDNYPMYFVNWNEANEFCRKLSQVSGLKIRLPTEAEWVQACRAGTTTPYSFGNSLNEGLANFDNNEGGVSLVRKYPPNNWGLYDMHGNVYEWCSDSPDKDKTMRHACRGGSWRGEMFFCRSDNRDHSDPNLRHNNVGFRILLED